MLLSSELAVARTNRRLAKLEHMTHDGHGGLRMEFRVPTRGLIGLHSQLLTATRGHSVMASRLLGYDDPGGVFVVFWRGIVVAKRPAICTR